MFTYLFFVYIIFEHMLMQRIIFRVILKFSGCSNKRLLYFLCGCTNLSCYNVKKINLPSHDQEEKRSYERKGKTDVFH